jgi:23S rRNA U2552 (ribose-2'-O)-methylase RlmE/FtsJ
VHVLCNFCINRLVTIAIDKDRSHLHVHIIMSTVNFNVGGKEFTISEKLIRKSHKLDYLNGLRISDEPIFLDYNFDAFSVVLDFLRHDKMFIPSTVHGKLVELIIDDLGIQISYSQRERLRKAADGLQSTFNSQEDISKTHSTEESPPQYTPSSSQLQPVDLKEDTDSERLTEQLFDAVEQKVADLILRSMYPRIKSQARQGSFRTSYVLLPQEARNGTVTSKFEASKFIEMVYLDEEKEKFLTQPEVMAHFEEALKVKVGLPVKILRRVVYVRRENEFGILETAEFSALVIDFELHRSL